MAGGLVVDQQVETGRGVVRRYGGSLERWGRLEGGAG